MEVAAIVGLLVVLAARSLLWAHHAVPRYRWEQPLTALAVALSVTVLVLYGLRLKELVGA